MLSGSFTTNVLCLYACRASSCIERNVLSGIVGFVTSVILRTDEHSPKFRGEDE